MWAILGDPGHAGTFHDLVESFDPMRGLVERLAQRPYADDLFPFSSMACFVLTTAPSYREAEGHDRIAIDFDPEHGLFEVLYCEWASPTRNPPHHVVACRSCERAHVAETIDTYVLRLLLLRRAR